MNQTINLWITYQKKDCFGFKWPTKVDMALYKITQLFFSFYFDLFFPPFLLLFSFFSCLFFFFLSLFFLWLYFSSFSSSFLPSLISLSFSSFSSSFLFFLLFLILTEIEPVYFLFFLFLLGHFGGIKFCFSYFFLPLRQIFFFFP